MKKIFILGLIAVAIAATVLIRKNSIESNIGTFADAKSTSYEVQVIGHLDKQKEIHNEDNNFSFFMKDSVGQECKVMYTGFKLDSLEQSAYIIGKGHMDGNVFRASSLTAMMKP